MAFHQFVGIAAVCYAALPLISFVVDPPRSFFKVVDHLLIYIVGMMLYFSP
jgi:hypothetical protein